ncbi:uncharacterized protein [Eleutherodactylus coqui]|uniref:uncharacterized protein n=1 Tax=Eleutherodactylus coqui TaxID=57060 RepID=UPI0034624F6A
MDGVMERIRAAVEERGLDWLVSLLDAGAPGPEHVGAGPAQAAGAEEAAPVLSAAAPGRGRGRSPAAAGSRVTDAAAGRSPGTVHGRNASAVGRRGTQAAERREPRPRRARAPARLSPDLTPQRRRRIESPSRAPPGRLPVSISAGGERGPGRNLTRRVGAASGARSRAARGAGPGTGPSAERAGAAWGRSPGEVVVGEQPHSFLSVLQDTRPVGASSSSRGAAATPVARLQPDEDLECQRGSPSDEDSDPLEGGSAAGGTTAPTQPDPCAALVWIMGHSYVFWGGERAKVRPNGRQLRLSKDAAVLRWIGVRGMAWSRVLQDVQRLVSLDRTPDILVLHVGGNDLGRRPFRELGRDIRYDMLRLLQMYRSLILVWSEMVPRKVWRNVRSVRGIDKARIKVNREVSRFVVRNGGVAVRHIDLEKGAGNYWRGDGVHLNEIGTDLWLEGIQEGIERALVLWGAAQA